MLKKNNQRYKTTKTFAKQIRDKYFYKAEDFITLIFDSFTPRFLVNDRQTKLSCYVGA